jgi:ketosteroid isomerase-like protein
VIRLVRQGLAGALLLAGALGAQVVPPGVPAAVPGSAADSASVQGLLALRTGLVDAFNRRDMDRMLALLEDSIVVTWQNGEVSRGKEEIRRYYDRMMVGKDRIVDSVSFNPVVEGRHVFGTTSLAYGNLNDDFTTTDGMHLPMHSRWTASAVRSGDGWRLASFHASANVFDNPVTQITQRRTAYTVGGIALVIGLVLGALLGRSMARPRAAV